MWLEQEEGDEGAGERKVLLQEGEEERTGELGFSPFNCMPDDDWCFDHAGRHRGFGFSGDPSPAESLLLQSAANSSSSGSPPSVFNLDPSSSSSQPFFPQQTRDDSLPSIFAVVASNPFDEFLQNPSLLMHSICANEDADGCTPFFGRTKVLQPLDVLPATGAPPTLFQKRAAALRQSSEPGAAERERSISALSDGNELSGVNYDGAAINGGEEDAKGKKKGLPAKNLMAERRRRKKLNDRLYLLRSVVPKISKMDRASILGDAIEYLKDLLQKINDLHEELAGTPPSLPPLPGGGGGASFHPLTPTLPALPPRVKEELCPSSLQSPNAQIPKVEVREREGRAVNIHMFCTRKPGILLSTMKALDNLGLDVQQAVISCFNGFAVDIFRAEPYNDSPRIRADEIKAVLLHSVNCLGSM